MLRHPWTGFVLVALLMVSALTTCLLTLRWFFAVGELQRLQGHSELLTRTSGLMQQLATEAIDYSRRDPSIAPVLSQLNLKAPGLGPTPPTATPPTAPLTPATGAAR